MAPSLLLFRADKSTNSIKQEIQAYFSSGYLCDFKIISKKSVYNIHKLLLAVACPQLAKIFNQDDKVELLNLSDFGEHEVESFVYALYHSKHNSNYSKVLESISGTNEPFLLKTPLAIKYEKNETNSIPLSSNTINDRLMDQVGPLSIMQHKIDLDICLPDNTDFNDRLDNKDNLIGDQLYEKLKKNKTRKMKTESGTKSCDRCGEFCGTLRNLHYHRKHKCKKSVLACPYCPRKFISNLAVAQHITKEHKQLENMYRNDINQRVGCGICKKSILKSSQKYHKTLHESNPDLSKFASAECPECGKKSFRSKKAHSCNGGAYMFEDNEGNVNCTICLNKFTNKKDIVKHVEETHPEEYRKKGVWTGQGSYVCPFPNCAIIKPVLHGIKLHLKKIHFAVKDYSCTICQEKFNDGLKKKRHIKTVHNIAGEFQCDQCGKDFVRQGILREHVYLQHSQEMRFMCKYCERGFKQNGDLKRHLFVHEAHLSKYKCDECDKTFRDLSTLKAHIKLAWCEKS